MMSALHLQMNFICTQHINDAGDPWDEITQLTILGTIVNYHGLPEITDNGLR